MERSSFRWKWNEQEEGSGCGEGGGGMVSDWITILERKQRLRPYRISLDSMGFLT